MPFGFRKSIGLGGGARINFSKSGVGGSFGIRGLRISTNNRGTYVNMGSHGVRYRAKIGGPFGQSPQSATVSPNPSVQSHYGAQVQTANALDLVDQTSAATLATVNATIRTPPKAWIVVVVGLLVGVGLLYVHWGFCLAAIGAAGYLTWVVHIADQQRRTYNLEYNLDDSSRNKWITMNTALYALAQTHACWSVTSQTNSYDWKRNAGATTLIGRLRAQLFQGQPPGIVSKPFTPYCLDMVNQQLFFLPDRLYVYQNGNYGAVEYSALQIGSSRTKYIEAEQVCSDAQKVGQTWQYVNKDGSPDRRFNGNRALPVMVYGLVTIKSNSGLNCSLMTSSIQAADQFAQQFAASQQIYTVGANPGQQAPPHQHAHTQPGQQSSSHTSSRPNPPHNQPPHPQQQPPPYQRTTQASPLPRCYEVLQLPQNCTKEEATAKHRKLATDYHPDRVNNLAKEFRDLAHAKMVEINAAYAELQKLRGW